MAFSVFGVFGIVLLVVLLSGGLMAALGVFVYRDAPRYGMDPLGWTLAAVLIPNLMGLILYLIVRSGKSGSFPCPSCGQSVKDSYHCCPYCAASLDRSCPRCGYALLPDWTVCPRCGGDPAEQRQRQGSPVIVWVLVAIFVVLVVALAGGLAAFRFGLWT